MHGKVKQLMNVKEVEVNERLKKICEACGAHVFPKVRVADVLQIEKSGIDDEDYSFALRAHFDFIVTDEAPNPLFAVEFDGAGHFDPKRRGRDRRKDALCRRFYFPLLRINSRYLEPYARGMDLLTWLVDVWFTERAFEAAQEAGEMAYDDGFLPASVISDGSGKKFPFSLSLPAANAVVRLWLAGKVREQAISRIVGRDSSGNLHGLGYIRISGDSGVIARSGMRAQNFSIHVADLLEEIVVLDVFEALRDVLAGNTEAVSMEHLESERRKHREKYRVVSSGEFGRKSDLA